MLIKEALLWGWKKLKDKSNSAALDAEILLLAAIGKNKDKIWLYVHPEYRLTSRQEKKYKELLHRRAKKEPIAYITGHKEFFGLNILVNKNVLIPRPETEILVEETIRTIKNGFFDTKEITLIDVGTGSGCIPLAIAKNISKIENIYAFDISPNTIKLARLNARKQELEKRIIFKKGDLLEPLLKKDPVIRTKYLIITANLPYISFSDAKDLPVNVKSYEPRLALVGGKNGPELILKLLSQIRSYLDQDLTISEIYLFLEIDPKQKNAITKRSRQLFGDCDVEVIKDLRKKDRVIRIAIKRNF